VDLHAQEPEAIDARGRIESEQRDAAALGLVEADRHRAGAEQAGFGRDQLRRGSARRRRRDTVGLRPERPFAPEPGPVEGSLCCRDARIGEGLQESDQGRLVLRGEAERSDGAGAVGRVEVAAAIVEVDDLGQSSRRAIVEERRPQRDVAQRRRAHASPISRVVGDELTTSIRERRRDTGVVEAVVGRQRTAVTGDARGRRGAEDLLATQLLRGECIAVAAQELIERALVADQRALIGRQHHRDASGGDRGRTEDLPEELRVIVLADEVGESCGQIARERQRPSAL
jgi:hypothetical protein